MVLSINDCIISKDGSEYQLIAIEKHPSGILSPDLIFRGKDGNDYQLPESMVMMMIENGVYSII